jgi:hypothetical protein
MAEPGKMGALITELLPRELKRTAIAAFREPARLAELSPEERESAARAFEVLAESVVDPSTTQDAFKFRHGEVVVLADDTAIPGLTAGHRGTVDVIYATIPPAYEVTFRGPTGEEFSAPMYEDEIAPLT